MRMFRVRVHVYDYTVSYPFLKKTLFLNPQASKKSLLRTAEAIFDGYSAISL
jgi:hypothetical protein